MGMARSPVKCRMQDLYTRRLCLPPSGQFARRLVMRGIAKCDAGQRAQDGFRVIGTHAQTQSHVAEFDFQVQSLSAGDDAAHQHITTAAGVFRQGLNADVHRQSLGRIGSRAQQVKGLERETSAPGVVERANHPAGLTTAQATEGWVSVNGALGKARLVPASQFPKGVPTEWDRKTFEIPKRERALSGEVVGNVVQIPGQDANLKSVGAGLSWKTPWKSKVSVGAESLLSQGRSSVDLGNQAPIVDQRVDGVQPYVRVEIDL